MSSLPKDYSIFLVSQGLAKGSIRNYVADLVRFIRWFEEQKNKQFSPELFDVSLFSQYSDFLRNSSIPENTRKRNLASLTKFSKWINPQNIPTIILSDTDKTANVKSDKIYESNQILSDTSNLSNQYSYFLEKSGLSKGSIRNYLADLNKFSVWFAMTYGKQLTPSDITAAAASAYVQNLSATNVPVSTIRRYVTTLKQFSGWANPGWKFFRSPNQNLLRQHQQLLPICCP